MEWWRLCSWGQGWLAGPRSYKIVLSCQHFCSHSENHAVFFLGVRQGRFLRPTFIMAQLAPPLSFSFHFRSQQSRISAEPSGRHLG